MKKLMVMMAMLAGMYTAKAQMVHLTNNVSGDVYYTVYATAPGCGGIIDFVPAMLVAGGAANIDLTLASSWASNTVPTVPYDLTYATVSRDPSCAGSFGWGAITGPCWMGGDEFYDEMTIGDPACGYNDHGCLVVTFSGGGTCGNFAAGDSFWANFAPGGTNVHIDVNW